MMSMEHNKENSAQGPIGFLADTTNHLRPPLQTVNSCKTPLQRFRLRGPIKPISTGKRGSTLRRSTSASLAVAKAASAIPQLKRSQSFRSSKTTEGSVVQHGRKAKEGSVVLCGRKAKESTSAEHPNTRKQIEDNLQEVVGLVKHLYLEKEDMEKKCCRMQRLKHDHDRQAKDAKQLLSRVTEEKQELQQAIQGQQTQLAELTKQKAESETRLKNLTAKLETTAKECQTVRSQLQDIQQQRSNRCEQSTCTEPMESVVQEVEALNKVALDAVKQQLAESQEKYSALEQQLVKLTVLEEQLELGQQREETLNLAVETLKTQLETKTAEAERQQKNHEEQLCDLQGSLAERDGDITALNAQVDRLNRETQHLMATVGEQSSGMDALQKELDGCREMERQRNILQDQIQHLQTAGKEAEEFLQLEQATLKDEAKELRMQLDATKLELSRCQAERDSGRQSLQQLQTRLQQTQAELDQTKVQAHYMLLQQGSEISSSITALTKLTSHLSALHENLECRVQTAVAEQTTTIEEKSKESVRLSTPQTPSAQESSHQASGSFVTSVLSAVHGTDGSVTEITNSESTSDLQPANQQTEPESPDHSGDTCEASNAADSSAGSAFTRVGSQNSHESVADKEQPLNEQIEMLSTLVWDIIQKLKVVDQATKETLFRLQCQIETLQMDLESQQVTHSKERDASSEVVSQLQEEIREMVKRERQLWAELSQAQQELSTRQADLSFVRELLEEKTKALAEVGEQKQQLTKWSQEVDRLTKLSTEKEAEKKAIQESLDLAMGRLARVDGAPGPDGASFSQLLRDSCVLKAEVSRLKSRALEKQEEAERKSNKLARHNYILRKNCEKADKELVRLDALVERIIQVMKKHTQDVRQWSELTELQADLGCEL